MTAGVKKRVMNDRRPRIMADKGGRLKIMMIDALDSLVEE
jgi:hypothetical protein